MLANDALDEDRLASFSDVVKGEWTGYEGEFDSEKGTVCPVPDFYIPEDFTSWGLTPKGFECCRSTIVRGTKYYVKFFRVLPQVALFADHVDLETSFDVVDFAEAESGSLFFDNGSYTLGKVPVTTVRNSMLDKWPCAELCIRHPTTRKKAVYVKVKFDFAKTKFVENINVIREEYSCIYCDGADIEGSSGYIEGWTIEPNGTPADLTGDWIVEDGTDVSNIARPDGGPPPEDNKTLYLPGGITLGLERPAENPENICVWAGWQFEENERCVLSRSYASDGSLIQSKMVTERRS